ncbi:MAG TPA: archaellin/type IV pilin N-terminal domain-containing protein [Candidatus Bathyarchaeia archaeon]
MKNFRKSRKALSPVVASIILIAVTVAVSIAVAAWMGALSVGFMQTEQLSITNAQFSGGNIVLAVRNTGTSNVTITSATVNGDDVTVNTMIPANTAGSVTVPYPTTSGNSYQIKLLSAKGTWFPYNAVAP